MSQLRSMLEVMDPSPPQTLSPPPPRHLMEERDCINAGLLRTMLPTAEGKGAASPPYPNLISRNSSQLPVYHVQLPVSREKIEYYVRLGFSQEVVESTIASLGPGAHDNDIMHRLNMRGAVTPPTRPVMIPEEATPPGPMTVPPVVCGGYGEGGAPPSSHNLRPIVVDGSNVAMR
jgi:hypothetical protein